jgi:hypothetical protein
MANHEDVDFSEHQIRLSKGVIAKFVQSLELEALIGAPSSGDKRKATAAVAFSCAVFCD